MLADDRTLMEGCLNNDRQSQELLYRKYATNMFHICLSFTGDRDEAKDILQDSFIKVFKGLRGFNPEKSLEGWIRKIVNNTAIDYYRKKRQLRYLENQAVENNTQEIRTENHEPSWLNTEQVLYHIRQLPEGARIIFHLFAIEGYSHKEIAGMLEISEGTSKSQYNRARMLLQGWISKTV